MNKIFKLILIVLTVILFVMIARLFDLSNRLDDLDHNINKITTENKILESSRDSLKLLLMNEKSKYDSLLKEMDSSIVRYDNINNKYGKIIDSIKYLNADESINFLRKKLEE